MFTSPGFFRFSGTSESIQSSISSHSLFYNANLTLSSPKIAIVSHSVSQSAAALNRKLFENSISAKEMEPVTQLTTTHFPQRQRPEMMTKNLREADGFVTFPGAVVTMSYHTPPVNPVSPSPSILKFRFCVGVGGSGWSPSARHIQLDVTVLREKPTESFGLVFHRRLFPTTHQNGVRHTGSSITQFRSHNWIT